jgi:hypothetical protein
MGYHVIVKAANGDLVSHYADSLEDLANFSDITADSIIYQGEPHWTPVMLGTDDKYKNFAKDWFRAGLKAQWLLKRQAIAHGLMIEDLSQDVESFKGYTINANVAIKRGDFLIRNARNLEIETKCFTFYKNGNEDCFYIEYADVKKHQNMEQFTGCPVILAVYKRCGDTPE